jgi:hypothetical protein
MGDLRVDLPLGEFDGYVVGNSCRSIVSPSYVNVYHKGVGVLRIPPSDEYSFSYSGAALVIYRVLDSGLDEVGDV